MLYVLLSLVVLQTVLTTLTRSHCCLTVQLQRYMKIWLFCRGSQEVISKRLKHLIRAKKLEDADVELDEYKLDFIIVIDFEATCEQDNPPGFIHEIIEFPAVVINVAKRETVSR